MTHPDYPFKKAESRGGSVLSGDETDADESNQHACDVQNRCWFVEQEDSESHGEDRSDRSNDGCSCRSNAHDRFVDHIAGKHGTHKRKKESVKKNDRLGLDQL